MSYGGAVEEKQKMYHFSFFQNEKIPSENWVTSDPQLDTLSPIGSAVQSDITQSYL